MKLLSACILFSAAEAFAPSQINAYKSGSALNAREKDIDGDSTSISFSRKHFFLNFAVVGASLAVAQPALADEGGGRPESLDIQNFLRTGTCMYVHFFVMMLTPYFVTTSSMRLRLRSSNLTF